MLNFETWPIERCIGYARNPRKNDHAVDKMASAIREFGFRVPIVAKSDGTVVDGHLRLKAAAKMGLVEVPVILADDLTETQIKAFRLSVNKVSEFAEWDIELLKLEFADLEAAGFDLSLTGFEIDEIAALDMLAESEILPGEGDNPSTMSLADKFGIAPFSVLNAREGWWQNRKRAWLALGIKSEMGRGEQIIPNGGVHASQERYKSKGGGLTFGNAPQIVEPGLNFYRNKNKAARDAKA